MPIPVLNLLKKYDLTSRPFTISQSINMVITDLKIEDDSIRGMMVAPWTFGPEFVSFHTDKPKKPEIYNDPIHLQMDFHKDAISCNVGDFYIHEAKVAGLDPVTLLCDADTLIFPWNISDRLSKQHDRWILEQYAGGYGGWSFGMKYLLAHHEFAPRKTIAIEAHMPYAVQFALSHGYNLIGDPDSMPEAFLRTLNENVCIHGNIQDLNWQKQLQSLYAEIWCISAPCKSWSWAGNQDGFANDDGLLLAKSIAQTRIHKPILVAIEQVAGFEAHCHFPTAMRMMHWAGYRPIHQGTFELADVTPCRRARWLGLFMHAESSCDSTEFFPWPKIPSTVRSFDMISMLSNQECHEFEPSVEHAAMYFDQTYMPGTLRVWSYKDILKYRIPSLDGKLPTFLHLYGQQHTLRPYRLTNMGLLGHFLRQGIAFRFFAPHEILLGHVHAFPMTLLKPRQIGWETIGNAIAMLHAVFLLFHALKILEPHVQTSEGSQIMQRLLKERIRASEIQLMQDSFAWYIGSRSQAEASQQALHFFLKELQWGPDPTKNRWPKQTFFSPEDGLLPTQMYSLTLTQDLTAEHSSLQPAVHPTQIDAPTQDLDFYNVALFLVPGEYGTLQVHKDVTLDALLSLWNHNLQPYMTCKQEHVSQPISHIFSEEKLFLVPKNILIESGQQNQLDWGLTNNRIILHRTSTDLCLYEVEHATTWQTAKQKHPQLAKATQSIFGPITSTTFFTTNTEVYDDSHDQGHPLYTCTTTIVQELFMKLKEVRFETFIPENTDIIVMHCTGSQTAKDAFFSFWFTEDHRKWLAHVGRQINVQDIDHTTWRILLRPILPMPSMPASVLLEALFWQLAQTIFQACQVADGIDCLFKMFGQRLCRVFLSEDCSLEPFLVALEHIRQLHPRRGTPSLHSSGKRCTEACTIHDLCCRRKQQGLLIIHVGMPLSGGGISGKTASTKQEFHKMIQSAIANRFMQHGFDLPQVTTATGKLIDKFGLARLNHMIHEEAPEESALSFQTLCSNAGIPLPKEGPQLHLVEAKYKKIRSQKQHLANKVDPRSIILLKGFSSTRTTLMQLSSSNFLGKFQV